MIQKSNTVSHHLQPAPDAQSAKYMTIGAVFFGLSFINPFLASDSAPEWNIIAEAFSDCHEFKDTIRSWINTMRIKNVVYFYKTSDLRDSRIAVSEF